MAMMSNQVQMIKLFMIALLANLSNMVVALSSNISPKSASNLPFSETYLDPPINKPRFPSSKQICIIISDWLTSFHKRFQM